MTRLSRVVAASGSFALLLLAGLGEAAAANTGLTEKHEAGRCAIRGQCGKRSIFGADLPCVDNGLATEPDDEVREQLVGLCGPKWKSGAICCDGEQVSLTRKSVPRVI